ncbi:hypothetical protein MATL_G00173600 [Megalops atlanticus]|uniref:Kinesin motor domain-containing protein n=1 Tax=Megalops atlanticus TaxID=7932 RepID=A0A9D3PU89_MEGAT|nr:hypothetical protein MATL_G00173600 [Megalops atlanticus]
MQQRLYPDLLQPMLGLILAGCHGTVLVGGTSRSGKENILESHSILKQFYPDDSAVDLLNPEKRGLRLISHPILGLLVDGLCEITVETAEEALALYEEGRETLRRNGGNLSSRCSFMYSVNVERRLQADRGRDRQYCRSSLRVFDLAGGARKGDLYGVSPLIKVLEHVDTGATLGNRLLPLLLTDSLTGHGSTVLLYSIQPQGLLDEETPCALALANRVRGLETHVTPGQWCPQAAAREIRERIHELRTRMVSLQDCGKDDTRKLEELIQALQVVKDQDWEKRREQSKEIKEKRKGYQAGSSQSGMPRQNTDLQGVTERQTILQNQLRQELEAHMREGKVGVEKSQERLGRIQRLREALREEESRLVAAERESGQSEHHTDQAANGLSQLSEVELEYTKALDRRKRLAEEHQTLIQEELAKTERELGTDKVSKVDVTAVAVNLVLTLSAGRGPEWEFLRLGRERQVLVLQLEALRRERLEAERDLEAQHRRHAQELSALREESLRVFRVFRQMFEEQREMTEGRYRTLLLEAIQDAVYLSAQNQQLQAENKQLHRALAELKDALVARGDAGEGASTPAAMREPLPGRG